MRLDREAIRVPIVFCEAEREAAVPPEGMCAARLAQARWHREPLTRRLEHVRKLRGLIAANARALATASAAGRHRPAAESLAAEVIPLAEACRFLEREAPQILAPRKLGGSFSLTGMHRSRFEIQREPLGVVLIIGPGNYPLLLPGVQLVQALVAGNAVLLKPGFGGTAAARTLIELLGQSGFDPGLVTLLPEMLETSRAAILAGPDKVMFTGSADTGEHILGLLAPRLIPAAMELSGCDAAIIRPDAGLDLVTKALVFGLTLNNGATCLAPRRVFVGRELAEELETRLANALQPRPSPRNRCGSPDRKWSPLLAEALADGAYLVAGDPARQGPIVLGGVSAESRLLHEDIFAPLMSIVPVDDDNEAVHHANDCAFGLGASIFSRDEHAARLLAGRLRVGVVTINDLIVPTADPRVPFGGRGRSGFGVTRGAEGLLEMTTPKTVAISRGNFRPAFENPRQSDEQLFQSYLGFAHGRGLASRCGAFFSFVRMLFERRKSIPSHQP